MKQQRRDKYEQVLLILARAASVGFAHVFTSRIPGLSTPLVAILMSLGPFDLMVSAPRPLLGWGQWKPVLAVLWPRLRSNFVTVLAGACAGLLCGLLSLSGLLPKPVGAAFSAGLAYVWSMRTPLVTLMVPIVTALDLFQSLTLLPELRLQPEFQEIDTPLNVALVVLVAAFANTAFSVGGNLLAVAVGWAVGAGVGFITRLLLSRPYPSSQSQAAPSSAAQQASR